MIHIVGLNQMTLYVNLKHKICILRVIPLEFNGSRAIMGYFHRGYKVMCIFIECSTYVHIVFSKQISNTLIYSIILLSVF